MNIRLKYEAFHFFSVCTLCDAQGEINSAKFSPNGTILASASFDRQICE